MEPLEIETIVKLNEEWFMHHFEKIVKRYIKSDEKQHMILVDLRCLLREANEI